MSIHGEFKDFNKIMKRILEETHGLTFGLTGVIDDLGSYWKGVAGTAVSTELTYVCECMLELINDSIEYLERMEISCQIFEDVREEYENDQVKDAAVRLFKSDGVTESVDNAKDTFNAFVNDITGSCSNLLEVPEKYYGPYKGKI